METAKKFKVTIEDTQCKGCLLCVHVCNAPGVKILKESENKTALGGTKRACAVREGHQPQGYPDGTRLGLRNQF